jgi:hypothetical protein
MQHGNCKSQFSFPTTALKCIYFNIMTELKEIGIIVLAILDSAILDEPVLCIAIYAIGICALRMAEAYRQESAGPLRRPGAMPGPRFFVAPNRFLAACAGLRRSGGRWGFAIPAPGQGL